MGSAFVFEMCSLVLDGASAADKIHDDRDQSKDQQQMNEEAAHVKNEEPSKPKQYQNDSQNEKHE